MKRRHFLKSVLCIILCLSMLTSCSSLGSRVSGENTEPEAPKSTQDNGKPLTIYCDKSERELVNLINAYNGQANEEDRLEIDTYGYDPNTREQVDAQKRLLTDLMAGKGPDLLLMTLTSFSTNQTTAMGSGLFQDLNYYFEQNPIDWNDYNKVVMDSGLYQGKRYLVPLSYQIPIYTTTKKTLERNGIPDTIDFTLDNFDKLLSYQDDLKANQTGFFNIAPDISLYICTFIDYDKQEHEFKTSKFKKSMEQYKILSQMQNTSMYLFENRMAFSNPQMMGSYIGSKNSYLKDDDKLILIADKMSSDSGTTAVPWNTVAINSNSPNGERAFKFIQWALSETTQKTKFGTIPVCKNAVVDYKVAGTKNEESMREYKAILDDVRAVQTYSDMRFVNDIFWPLWEDFLDDKITVEELSKQLSDKTDIYLQEL